MDTRSTLALNNLPQDVLTQIMRYLSPKEMTYLLSSNDQLHQLVFNHAFYQTLSSVLLGPLVIKNREMVPDLPYADLIPFINKLNKLPKKQRTTENCFKLLAGGEVTGSTAQYFSCGNGDGKKHIAIISAVIALYFAFEGLFAAIVFSNATNNKTKDAYEDVAWVGLAITAAVSLAICICTPIAIRACYLQSKNKIDRITEMESILVESSSDSSEKKLNPFLLYTTPSTSKPLDEEAVPLLEQTGVNSL